MTLRGSSVYKEEEALLTPKKTSVSIRSRLLRVGLWRSLILGALAAIRR